MKTFIFGLFLAFSLNSHALELASGDQFETIPMQGRVAVYCSDGQQTSTAHFYCSALGLSPAEFDYVVSSDLDADKITLKYTDSRGKKRSKSVGFDSNKQRSTKRVNLWIGTLLQRPLLHTGANSVEFVATKKGNVVERATRTIDVQEGQVRECRFSSYSSRNLQDCRNSSFICQRYFQDQNYCL